MDRIVILGGGGHAKVVISMLRQCRTYTIAGYVDPEDRGDVDGVRYLGTDDELAAAMRSQAIALAALGIGHPRDAGRRRRAYAAASALGLRFPSVIHPAAVVAEDADVAEGSAVMAGAVVQPGTRVDRCAIVNTHATVDHDCRLGEFSHIASGATVCGGAVVAAGALVGAGAVVLPGCRIADGCVIGAGAVVRTDCTLPGTYVGMPARRIS